MCHHKWWYTPYCNSYTLHNSHCENHFKFQSIHIMLFSLSCHYIVDLMHRHFFETNLHLTPHHRMARHSIPTSCLDQLYNTTVLLAHCQDSWWENIVWSLRLITKHCMKFASNYSLFLQCIIIPQNIRLTLTIFIFSSFRLTLTWLISIFHHFCSFMMFQCNSR